MPPGGPGPVAVTVRNGDDDSTSRTLEEGYTYDAWFASPASGPTSGGTIVTVSGKGTSWVEGTVVKLGGAACQALEVLSATELRCTTPAHTPGSVSLSIRNPGEEERSVDDAFVFADSDNGFKGGLSGLALSGTMRVAAYNNYTGDPVVNATVILGDSLGTALQKKTDSAGIAVFSDAGLVGSRSVTIAKTCFEPGTFVDVPVDTVTAYLNPVMSPDCGADEHTGKVNWSFDSATEAFNYLAKGEQLTLTYTVGVTDLRAGSATQTVTVTITGTTTRR